NGDLSLRNTGVQRADEAQDRRVADHGGHVLGALLRGVGAVDGVVEGDHLKREALDGATRLLEGVAEAFQGRLSPGPLRARHRHLDPDLDGALVRSAAAASPAAATTGERDEGGDGDEATALQSSVLTHRVFSPSL